MVSIGDIQAVPAGKPGRGFLGYVATPPIELPNGIRGRALYYELRLLTDKPVPGARESGPIRLVAASDAPQKDAFANNSSQSDKSAIRDVSERPVQADGRSPLTSETSADLQRIVQKEKEGKNLPEDSFGTDSDGTMRLIERLMEIIRAQTLNKQGSVSNSLLSLVA